MKHEDRQFIDLVNFFFIIWLAGEDFDACYNELNEVKTKVSSKFKDKVQSFRF